MQKKPLDFDPLLHLIRGGGRSTSTVPVLVIAAAGRAGVFLNYLVFIE
jgi:hypothetical protein